MVQGSDSADLIPKAADGVGVERVAGGHDLDRYGNALDAVSRSPDLSHAPLCEGANQFKWSEGKAHAA
jgi:hypothetical protein